MTAALQRWRRRLDALGFVVFGLPIVIAWEAGRALSAPRARRVLDIATDVLAAGAVVGVLLWVFVAP